MTSWLQSKNISLGNIERIEHIIGQVSLHTWRLRNVCCNCGWYLLILNEELPITGG
jgi:hypothetical protein